MNSFSKIRQMKKGSSPAAHTSYFQNCGKLFLADGVRSHQIAGLDRFIHFSVKVRFFTIQGTDGMLTGSW